MTYDTVVVGALETNCYLVFCQETKECAVIDPGAQPEKIFQAVQEAGVRPIILINTHGHIDHIGANQDVKEHYNVPLYIHEDDEDMLSKSHLSELSFLLGAKMSPPADGFLTNGQRIKIGHGELQVLHTPGHSPGSICLFFDRFLFSGDTLFNGGVGRTDLPGGSWKDLEESIRTKILVLDENLPVLPGHGPSTTVGNEKDSNPFIQ
ncbi:MAG: MBL fold metallo-hydrolase [Acidobacteria bacterium]|nr:MBL fold metallo-hydrolase [Acidobacteriota bacterium]